MNCRRCTYSGAYGKTSNLRLTEINDRESYHFDRDTYAEKKYKLVSRDFLMYCFIREDPVIREAYRIFLCMLLFSIE